LFIAAATFCWGAAVTFGKAIFNGSVFAGRTLISPIELTQARTTFTVLVLVPVLYFRFGGKIFRISKSDLLLCVLVGTLGVACSNYFYYLAVQKATVALAITVQYTAPVWVLAYMVTRGRQKATPQRISAAIMAIAGITLAIGFFYSDAKISMIAVGAALMASFGYAFYNVAAQGMITRNHQLTIMTYVLLSSALLWLIVNPPWRLAAQHYSGTQWIFLFIFAVLSMLLPYIFYFSGLKYLDPTRAVITSCLEPVFAILFAAVFVHELLRPLQTVGIVAVLAATIVVQVSGKDSAPAAAA